jgi:hypothetical protein
MRLPRYERVTLPPDVVLPVGDRHGNAALRDYRGRSPAFLGPFRGLYRAFCRRAVAHLGRLRIQRGLAGQRPGHIPSAVNVPYMANIDRYAGAAGGLLVLKLLHIERARLYDGSWAEWSADPTRRAEVSCS